MHNIYDGFRFIEIAAYCVGAAVVAALAYVAWRVLR